MYLNQVENYSVNYLYESQKSFFCFLNIDYTITWHFKYSRGKWVQELVGPFDFDAVNKDDFKVYKGDDWYMYSEAWELFLILPERLIPDDYDTRQRRVEYLRSHASNIELQNYHKKITEIVDKWQTGKYLTEAQKTKNGKKQKDLSQ